MATLTAGTGSGQEVTVRVSPIPEPEEYRVALYIGAPFFALYMSVGQAREVATQILADTDGLA